MLIDSHNHIHSQGYKLDALAEIASAKAAGVEHMLFVGEGLTDCRAAIELAQKTDNFATIGIHPHTAGQNAEELEEILPLALEKNNRVVAIGECGLDYFYMHSDKTSQKATFLRQIEFAASHRLPLVFHIRGSKNEPQDAFSDFFDMLNDFKEVRGVVHSFTADSKLAGKILDSGLYLSLNGIITFAGGVVREMVQFVPLDKVLVETDAPYLTPVPFRGRINSPQYVVEVARAIAGIRGIDLAEVARQSKLNTERLFGL